jgi:hypothetical protein
MRNRDALLLESRGITPNKQAVVRQTTTLDLLVDNFLELDQKANPIQVRIRLYEVEPDVELEKYTETEDWKGTYPLGDPELLQRCTPIFTKAQVKSAIKDFVHIIIYAYVDYAQDGI